ncbi:MULTISPECIES: S8 family serine peptidase [unclassified Bacillus (in: firmicutes)]|uniref:S8 family peptidase n=1 Tax=unclassified Bacillus (in: firmicutes) TaxID=185979 RepID=UPI0008ED9A8D|nr:MULTISPECIES: S8 family serine peptidase [unclassified Bacillus (in: firmicutes)]SFB14601.1 Subtilase family protein [Bacillus sp. UNCCL13]SFQ89690.1 Subtilase family protein [Bacillus sp. cl95]
MKKKFIAGALSASLSAAVFLGSFGVGHAQQVDKNYLVVFKSEANLPVNYLNLINQAGGKVKKSLSKLGAVEVTSSNPNFLAEIKESSSVLDAGLENTVKRETALEKEFLTDSFSSGESNDLYKKYQWDIKQVTHDGDSWDLAGGSGKSTNGKDIIVAVVDTGIDYTHPDIKNNYAYGKSFVPGIESPMDEDGHGTHVAGSIAGNGRVLGIGPELKVAAYRVFGPDESAATSDIANALMTAADDNVDVVNMSLGGYDWFQNPEYATKDVVADVRLFNRAIQYAINKGVTVVGSAGNAAADISSPGKLSGDDKGATHRSPSNQGMIRVASSGQEQNLAWYSNYGVGKIDVIAPGGDYGTAWRANLDLTLREGNKRCLSTIPGGYAWYIGTSMAAPKTAGLAGVIIAKYGKDVLSPSQVKHIIQSSADDWFKPGYDGESGHGAINALNALNQ